MFPLLPRASEYYGNVLSSLGLGYYMVFEHDFGSNRHVFSWVSPVHVLYSNIKVYIHLVSEKIAET